MSPPPSSIDFVLGEVGTSGTSAEYQQDEDPTTEEQLTEIDFYISEADTLTVSSGGSEDERSTCEDQIEDFEEEIDFYISEKTDTLTLSSDGSEDDLSVTIDDLEEWPEELTRSDEEGKDRKHNNGAKSGVEDAVTTSTVDGEGSEVSNDHERVNDAQGAPEDAHAEPLEGPMKSSEDGSRSELHSNHGASTDVGEPGDGAQGAPKEGKKWSILPDSVKKLFARKSKSAPSSPTGSTDFESIVPEQRGLPRSESTPPAAFASIVPEQALEPEQQRRRRGKMAWASEPDLDRLQHEGAAGSAGSDEPQHEDAPTGRGSQGTGSGSSKSRTFSFPRFGNSRSAQVVPLEA